jgi:hypothetical protein
MWFFQNPIFTSQLSKVAGIRKGFDNCPRYAMQLPYQWDFKDPFEDLRNLGSIAAA